MNAKEINRPQGNLSGFKAVRLNDQSISSGVWTKTILNTIEFDQLFEYDAMAGRFTSKHGGVYVVTACVRWANATGPIGGITQRLGIYLNGVLEEVLYDFEVGSSETVTPSGSCIVQMNPNDYLELHSYSSTSRNILGSSNATYFTAIQLV
jgi:hypothetical protein